MIHGGKFEEDGADERDRPQIPKRLKKGIETSDIFQTWLHRAVGMMGLSRSAAFILPSSTGLAVEIYRLSLSPLIRKEATFVQVCGLHLRARFSSKVNFTRMSSTNSLCFTEQGKGKEDDDPYALGCE